MCRFLWPDKEHRQSINGFIVVICLIWIPCRSVAAIKCGNEFADAHKFILTLNFVMVHSLVDYIICVESFSWADTKRNETTTNSYANSIIINNLATMTMLRHRYKMSMQMLCVCHYTELWASSKIVRHRCRQFLHTLRSHMRHTHTHTQTPQIQKHTHYIPLIHHPRAVRAPLNSPHYILFPCRLYFVFIYFRLSCAENWKT